MTDHYFKNHHSDGRIENYHFFVDDIDTILDLLNEVQQNGKIKMEAISEGQFNAEQVGTSQKIHLHEDKMVDGDAGGETVGWFEHYELKS